MAGKQFGSKRTKYAVRNTHKYLGDPNNVVIRSSWEANTFAFCDNNQYVLAWCSEEIVIPYMKPVFGTNGTITYKPAKYFPDLYVEYVGKDGEVLKELIEIKPKKQTRASRARNYATNFYENMVYAVNTAKWNAARNWCQSRGIKFSIITEQKIFK